LFVTTIGVSGLPPPAAQHARSSRAVATSTSRGALIQGGAGFEVAQDAVDELST
jgi:hypothetical protein